MTTEKLDRFLKCIEKLIDDLAANHNLPVHSKINQFYYMQKIEELKLLKEQVEDQVKRLQFVERNLEQEYTHVFTRWSKDARWLNRHLASQQLIL